MSHSGAATDVGPSFLSGVDRGLRSDDVTHALFGARTLVLAGEMQPGDVGDWLSGMLIGAEIRAAKRWAQGAGIDHTSVRIIGDDRLAARYEAAHARASIPYEREERCSAARGHRRIAGQAGLLR